MGGDHALARRFVRVRRARRVGWDEQRRRQRQGGGGDLMGGEQAAEAEGGEQRQAERAGDEKGDAEERAPQADDDRAPTRRDDVDEAARRGDDDGEMRSALQSARRQEKRNRRQQRLEPRQSRRGGEPEHQAAAEADAFDDQPGRGAEDGADHADRRQQPARQRRRGAVMGGQRVEGDGRLGELQAGGDAGQPQQRHQRPFRPQRFWAKRGRHGGGRRRNGLGHWRQPSRSGEGRRRVVRAPP